jgi:hypothetical protein
MVVVLPSGVPADVPAGSEACTSVADCGAGTQGTGAVCDRASFELGVGAVGVCRDACLDYSNCAQGSSCVEGLDPDDPSWSGCMPQ